MRIGQPFFLILGCFFLGLGLIGVFLPVLPTTPFLIVAAFFLSRGSEKFHNWLIHHPTLGPPVLDWQKNRIIRTRHKALATTMMAITWIVIIWKDVLPTWGDGLYSLILAVVLAFIWSRRGH